MLATTAIKPWISPQIQRDDLAFETKEKIRKFLNKNLQKGCGDNALTIIEKACSCLFFCKVNPDDPKLTGVVVAERSAPFLNVCYIAVKKGGYRYRGLGTALMKKIFKLAKAENLNVTLEYSTTDLYRCKFYEKFHPICRDRIQGRFWLQILASMMSHPIFDPAISLNAIKHPSERPGRYFKKLNAAEELYYLKKAQFLIMLTVAGLFLYVFDSMLMARES